MKQRINKLFLIILLIFIGACTNNQKKDSLGKKEIKRKNLSYDLRLRKSILRYKEIKRESNYHEQVKELKEITFCYSKLDSLDSVITHGRKTILLSTKINDFSSIGFSYYYVGLGFKRLKQYDSAYFNYQKSKDFYLKLKDSFYVAKRLLNLAKIESANGLYYKSDSTAIQALKYLKNTKSKIVTSLYNCLGINANQQKQYNEAIEWYNLAINSSNNKIKILRYRNNKANNSVFLKDYNKAILYYKKIISDEYYDSIPLKLRAKIIDNYALVKILNGQNINENEFLKAQKIKIKIEDYEGLISNYSYLSDFFKLKKKDSRALEYAHKMYSLSKEEKRPNDRIEAIDRLISLVNDKVVRKYAKERSYLKDSIINARRNSRNKLVKIIYNFDLLEKQKLKAQIDVEQQKSQKQLWVFIGLTTFLGFIVYFFYKRNKTKKEKIIEVYKTETRLAKKIHDELANDVYLAMNKIQKENREDTSVLCDLEKIYLLTRNISHENSPVVTGEQFEGFLKQLFLEFSIDSCRVMSKGLPEVQVNTLAKEKQIVMYRVLQELLVNMKKHSKANLVVISFSVLKGAIQVRYKDNGIGIDNLSLKNGLQNMETRIKSIGGTIIFESEIQKGFQAKFQLKK